MSAEAACLVLRGHGKGFRSRLSDLGGSLEHGIRERMRSPQSKRRMGFGIALRDLPHENV